MTHEEMVDELITRYPHREEELKRLDELLVYKDDDGFMVLIERNQ